MFPLYKSAHAARLNLFAKLLTCRPEGGSADPPWGQGRRAAKECLRRFLSRRNSGSDASEARFGHAATKEESDHEKRLDIPGRSSGEQRQAGNDRKTAGRSASWPCPPPC